MKLSAKPQPNGNHRDHFADAYMEIKAAQRAVEKARATVMWNVLHGRNYQHLVSGDVDVCLWERREVDKIFFDVTRSLGLLASDISDTLDEEVSS